jgi:hypothetical protein
MIQKLKDYTKCVIANRATLAGGIFFGLGLVGEYFKNKTGVEIPKEIISLSNNVGEALLGLTWFGLETYTSYIRTRRHIEENGGVAPRFRDKYLSSLYCNKTGFKLAVKEAGLEGLIKK